MPPHLNQRDQQKRSRFNLQIVHDLIANLPLLRRIVRWTMDFAMIEILFIYQLARNPVQAIARRWWCRSLYRASRGKRQCPECTNS